MNKNLFNNREEEKSFYDLLADRKLKKINKNKESYDSDINEDLIKCEEIFTKNNAKTNYVSELLKLNKEDTKNPEILQKIEILNKEFKKFLNTLTLVEREDLEFYSQKVSNRLERIREANLIAKNLKSFYPNLVNYEYEDRMQIFDLLFGEKSPYKVTPLKESSEKGKPVLDENLEKEKIKIIKPEKKKIISKEKTFIKGNDSLSVKSKREEVLGIKTFKKEEEKTEIDDVYIYDEAVPKENFVTDSFFELDNLDDKREMAEEEIILEETIEPELDVLNPFEIDFEELSKEKPVEEKIVKFVMPKDTSLVDISVAICGDSSGWLDIFAENKELLNKAILDSNANYINIENNQNIFSGLEINIPVVFKKNIDKENLKTM